MINKNNLLDPKKHACHRNEGFPSEELASYRLVNLVKID